MPQRPHSPPALALAIALGVTAAAPGCDRRDPPRAPRSAGPSTAASPTTATTTNTTPPDPALSEDAARALAATFQNAGATPTVRGTTVRADGHVVVASVMVGSVSEEPDQAVAAIEVALEVDGQRDDVFRVSSIAIDSNRREALARAIREWSVAYALPIVDALRANVLAAPTPTPTATPATPDGGPASPPRPAPLVLAEYAAFRGPTGTRGEIPESWREGAPANIHDALLGLITPALNELLPPPRAGYHTLKITLHVRNAAANEGECRVDGRPAPRLCDVVRAFAWPAGDNDYLFKQFYVLAPRAH